MHAMRCLHVPLLLCLASPATGFCAAADLVACWRFDEGQGAVLHDSSGNGNHGKIDGARWVRHGKAWALEFDGVDDRVDCGAGPSLDLHGQVSMVAWVWSEPQTQAGEPGIAGKAYSSYVITQYGEQVWTYISGGPNNAKAALTPGRWHHVASTYDGQNLKLYVDGQLAATKRLGLEIKPGDRFWMGWSDGAVKYTRNAHFCGKLTDVRVYSRALTLERIRHHARTTNLSGIVALSPTPIPMQSRLLVGLDKRGLGATPRDLNVRVDVLRLGVTGRDAGVPVASAVATKFDDQDRAEVSLSMRGVPAGTYLLRASARDATNAVTLHWTARPEFPRGKPGAKQLNNLVVELLHVRGPEPAGRQHTFVNPRPGWVWIRNRGAAAVTLSARGDAAVREVALPHQHKGAHETMRRLPAGPHIISSRRTEELVVRGVPELVFARYDSNPHCTPCGPYQGAFHRRHVFPNTNTFVGRANEPFAEEWRKRGGKWLVRCSVPKSTPDAALTAEAAREYILKHQAFALPFVDGLIADEFGGSTPDCASWASAVGAALGDHPDKSYYPYASDLWNGAEGRQLVAALVKHGSMVAWKRYLKEQRTEADAWRFLDRRLVHSAQQYRKLCPDSIRHIVVCFGYFSAPPEQLDTFPHVNYKTYLDMQFSIVASHPAFEDIGGVMSYLASYADEETVRWMMRLFRHYAIEGHTETLSADPYELPHLRNGDFEDQGQGWGLSPAEEGGIRFSTSPGFGWLQGRYPRTKEGDTVVVMKRSGRRPNLISQTIRELTPGRLYSLRLYSADFKDMSTKAEHALSIGLEGARLVAGNCFTHVFANCYSHGHGPYDRKHKAWMNYHWRVFRAQGETAQLSISDWASPDAPGGPLGQEIMCNFAQVQPYDAR